MPFAQPDPEQVTTRHPGPVHVNEILEQSGPIQPHARQSGPMQIPEFVLPLPPSSSP
jgi:hypothetical protein